MKTVDYLKNNNIDVDHGLELLKTSIMPDNHNACCG